MNQTEFIGELLALGFKRRSTASAKWKLALVLQGAHKTLALLIRRNGVDLLETSLTPDDMTIEEGRLRILSQREGDRFVELGYTEADASIHDIALHAASCIAHGNPIADEIFTRRGIGPREWSLKYGALSKRGSSYSPSSDHDLENGGTMQDVYDAISNGDGADAYMGDGTWVRSDGRTYDDGR